MALPKKITINELADIVGVSDKQLYKLKSSGCISQNERGEWDAKTLRQLFDHYRKGGDDTHAQLQIAKLEKEKAGAEILKTKEKRLKRKLVDFDLIKADFASISIEIRNRLLAVGDNIAQRVLACDNTESARELIHSEITHCLTLLSDLKPERYDGVTDEEVESEVIEDGERDNG